ncbi:hypothetical protein GIB67_024800 [Kingdonia uniflora]|uniref:Pyroglutamyl-peptidase I n=1 Tax=Kingdonia uniflora TaxID=39325 RepID=A0A7J7LID8_9MAGN|nr:hypothetical protein GIB67_038288 [Kingdonia uniflora]KAF6172178.1 hypothetical protein GIB67_024800 [Kingdonia uniflora]
MGSEGPSVVKVYVTGFKKFHGVAENPTETIVSNLKQFLQKNGLPKGLNLESCNVLEAAGQGGLSPLYQVMESSVTKPDSNPGHVILLHFGVNSGATRFAIEYQAVNEATFRCPDELGWKPQKIPIVPADGGIQKIRKVYSQRENNAMIFQVSIEIRNFKQGT